MKKIIFILSLFISASCFSQVAINIITPTSGHTACNVLGVANIVHSNMTFNAGRLYIAVVMSDSATNHGLNISGTHFTWDTILQAGNNDRRISFYRGVATVTGSTDDPKAEWTSGYPSGISFHIYEVLGVVVTNNGADAVEQAVSSGATGADPSLTLASLQPTSGVIAAFVSDVNPFSGTPESGWTEDRDGGCQTWSGGQMGIYVMKRVGGADNTPTVTSASSTWLGAAIELIGNRRIFNVH